MHGGLDAFVEILGLLFALWLVAVASVCLALWLWRIRPPAAIWMGALGAITGMLGGVLQGILLEELQRRELPLGDWANNGLIALSIVAVSLVFVPLLRVAGVLKPRAAPEGHLEKDA